MARNRSLNEGDQAAPSEAVENAATEAPGPAPVTEGGAPEGTEGGSPAADPQPAPEAAEPAEAKPKSYVVAPGATVVGARGKLGPGDTIHAGELSSEQLEAFIAAGAVVEA